MRVLITCLSYGKVTGSEMYVYELARGLTNLGHDVLVSAIQLYQGEMVNRSKWKVCEMGHEPEFKPDIIHCNQRDTAEVILRSNTTVPIVCTIHSEVIPQHEGVISDPRVRKYIAVRPSIKKMCLALGVKPSNVSIIYNPIDFERFNLPVPENGNILFAGTYYNLRSKAVQDITKCPRNNVYFVGDNFMPLSKEFNDPKLFFLPPTWEIEKILKSCQFTAGINYGRTALEGFVSGRQNINYTVDSNGEILSREILDRPKDFNKFDSREVVNSIIKVYENS